MKYSKYPFYISQLIIKSLKGQLTEAEQADLGMPGKTAVFKKEILFPEHNPLCCCCFVISYDQHCRLPVLETVSFCFYPHGLADGTASGFSQGIFGFCIRRNGKSGR